MRKSTPPPVCARRGFLRADSPVFEALGVEGAPQPVPLYKMRNECNTVRNRTRPIWERNPKL